MSCVEKREISQEVESIMLNLLRYPLVGGTG
jgi:hypothetical protein